MGKIVAIGGITPPSTLDLIDNDCAIEFVDDSYRIIATNDGANAYKVYKEGINVKREVIYKNTTFRKTNELLK